MGLLLCAVVSALVVGWATGGGLDRLALVPLRGWPTGLLAGLAVVGGALLASQGGGVGRVAGVAGPALAAGCLLVLLIRNRSIEGVPLFAVGLLLNAVVIGANGAMPVSLYAEARAGVSPEPLASGTDPSHELAGPDTRFSPARRRRTGAAARPPGDGERGRPVDRVGRGAAHRRRYAPAHRLRAGRGGACVS